MSFEVIPAVDIKDGKCVQLVQGIPGTEMISLDDPVGVAKRWTEEGAKRLHLVDLDGAFEGTRKNAQLVKQIVEMCSVPIQVGGGIRSYEDAANLLNLGIDRIIIGTAAMNDPTFVKRLIGKYGGERIMVALDTRNNEVVIEGWKRSAGVNPIVLGTQMEKLGVGSILFTNVNVEGLLRGVDPEPIRALVQSVRIPVVASGGVASLNDLTAIKDTGAAGVVVGSALYKGNFTLREAMKVME